jgi:hypothetical protein
MVQTVDILLDFFFVFVCSYFPLIILTYFLLLIRTESREDKKCVLIEEVLQSVVYGHMQTFSWIYVDFM